jgi:hypothetical protein
MPENEMSEMVNLLQKISDDIAIMKNFARLQAMEAISAVLSKVASTPERQQMWRLADGNRGNEEIARMIGVALRSVQYFVQEAQDAGVIIMKRRGYPGRIVDVFPPGWKAWKPKVTKTTVVEPEVQKSQSPEGEIDVKE